MFPPTFLYTTSWEDPRPDVEASLHPAQHALASAIAMQGGYDTRRQLFQVLEVKKEDTVLTLTSGGCNALNLLLHGAGHVRWPLPSVLLLAAHYLWEDVVLPSCDDALLVPADIELGPSTRPCTMSAGTSIALPHDGSTTSSQRWQWRLVRMPQPLGVCSLQQVGSSCRWWQ